MSSTVPDGVALPARLASQARSGLRSLVRWLALCVATGVMAGLAAAAFVSAVEALQLLTLDTWMGVSLARPEGEAHALARLPGAPLLPLWMLPLVPAAGALLAGLVARFTGDAVYGGGTGAVIDAYHHRHGALGLRVSAGKWVASVLTLGTGGSGGREGPMTLVGAGIGSTLGWVFRLGRRERRLLLLAGAGAAMGAVFRIPLGSAIFAIEMLYRDGFEEEGIFPCLIASVSAYSVFLAIHGAGHLFATPDFGTLDLGTVPLFVLAGIAVVPFGYVLTAAIDWVRGRARALPLPRWALPAVGGLLVGLMGLLWNHELLGIGYGWVQQLLQPAADLPPGAEGAELGTALGVAGTVALLALGKIVATALTVGTGGSAGTFAPTVLIGGLVGGALGTALTALMPGSAPSTASFVLVGMGALLAGVAHVPLAAVVIVCELVGNYELLVPLMAAVGVSYLLQRRTSLYPAQARNPAASPVWAGSLAADALGTLRVADLGRLRPAPSPVHPGLPLSRLVERLGDGEHRLVPVEGAAGGPAFMVTTSQLLAAACSPSLWPTLIVQDIAVPLVAVGPGESLREVFALLDASHDEEVFVRGEDGALAGVVGMQDLARLPALLAARDAVVARRGAGP